jgi:branched-chain amino acid transport system substrate-binding protein
MNETIAWIAGLAVAGMLAAGTVQAQDVVKIGFASPLTGGQASYGKDNQNGAELAIRELNAQPFKDGDKTVKFELVAEDDQAEPKLGPVIAQKLVDAKVAGVVGHFNSGVTIPASKVYSDAGIPELSVSTNTKYTQQGFKTAFRLMADDGKQGKALGEYAVNVLKLKRVAVIDDSTAYGQGLADEFERAVKASGAQVVAHEHSNDKAVDFASLLTSIKGNRRTQSFRRLRSASRTEGPSAANAWNERADGRRNDELGEVHIARRPGCRGPSRPPGRCESRPNGEAFAASTRDCSAKDGLYAPYFYDGVMLIATAMKAANSTDPAKYLPALQKIRYPGITADIEFDPNGDLTHGLMTISQVKNGKWEVISK